jgi:glycerol-3-phosphate O-acyltransferase 1/2
MDSTISDALLVPVSINYEKLVDGNFVYEQLGQKKKPETFSATASAIMKVVKAKFGLIRIDFNEPFSLRELIKSFDKSDDFNSSKVLMHKPSSSSLFGTDVVQEEHRVLVDSIARHVLYDCSNATSVMTTNAIAFLLLNRFRDGATLSVLTEAVEEFRVLLKDTCNVGFTGESEDVVRYAVNLLGPGLVTKEKRGAQTFIRPVTIIPNVIELSYYSNAVVPHFALESIVTTSAVLLKKDREMDYQGTSVSISKERLIEMAVEFCDIMKYEFLLLKPCQNLSEMIEDTIARLALRDILHEPEVTKALNKIYLKSST